jgi:hypothetical protein
MSDVPPVHGCLSLCCGACAHVCLCVPHADEHGLVWLSVAAGPLADTRFALPDCVLWCFCAPGVSHADEHGLVRIHGQFMMTNTSTGRAVGVAAAAAADMTDPALDT